MQTKFKRHQKVKLLVDPDTEFVEFQPDKENLEIKKGMFGKINVILPNGQYHVEILDSDGETLAYAAMSEESLESVSE